MSETSISGLAKKFADDFKTDSQLRLKIGEVSVSLHSNSTKLVADLVEYFGDVVVAFSEEPAEIEIYAYQTTPPEFSEYRFKDWPRDPGKVGKKEAYSDFPDGRIVRKVRTGMHFLISRKHLVAIGPCVENSNQITNFINSQYTSRRLHEGWSLCHAAGVALQGQGLGVAARAGSGKSTLALHLMSSGLSFVSNDRLLINDGEAGPQMAGIPKMPRVNPGTLLNNPDLTGILSKQREAELAKLAVTELWQLEEKYDVMIDSVYGQGRSIFQVPLKAMLILNWTFSSKEETHFSQVTLRERPDLLDLVVKSPGVFHRNPEGKISPSDVVIDREAYLKHLANTPIWEATGHADFEKGVTFCRTLLDG